MSGQSGVSQSLKSVARRSYYCRIPANGPLRINGRPEYVKSACDASLQRLGIDCIDLFYQHRMDPSIPIEDTVGTLADLNEVLAQTSVAAGGGAGANRPQSRGR